MSLPVVGCHPSTLMHLPTQIELRRVEQLLPCARNSRVHSDEQIAQVAASIREFGWTNPVLVGPDDGSSPGTHGCSPHAAWVWPRCR